MSGREVPFIRVAPLLILLFALLPQNFPLLSLWKWLPEAPHSRNRKPEPLALESWKYPENRAYIRDCGKVMPLTIAGVVHYGQSILCIGHNGRSPVLVPELLLPLLSAQVEPAVFKSLASSQSLRPERVSGVFNTVPSGSANKTLSDVVAPPRSSKSAETVAEFVPIEDTVILGCLVTDCLYG